MHLTPAGARLAVTAAHQGIYPQNLHLMSNQALKVGMWGKRVARISRQVHLQSQHFIPPPLTWSASPLTTRRGKGRHQLQAQVADRLDTRISRPHQGSKARAWVLGTRPTQTMSVPVTVTVGAGVRRQAVTKTAVHPLWKTSPQARTAKAVWVSRPPQRPWAGSALTFRPSRNGCQGHHGNLSRQSSLPETALHAVAQASPENTSARRLQTIGSVQGCSRRSGRGGPPAPGRVRAE